MVTQINISTYFSRNGDTKFGENPSHRLSSLNTADGRTYIEEERCWICNLGLHAVKNVKPGNAQHVYKMAGGNTGPFNTTQRR